ncbi:TlpA disulfide reductase family protein [uncultured Peptoniphilus sp.]|uniref:TlpA family protein disulfide reductase n=1 Tax=uncultured Peptoniphilus sp. TaxID=254354 RepID=UPI0025829D97|nr:TlpA disulfide reductase family protein [uncultured Peptoniphilus sp.]MDU6783531.1 TlpA disulfide reductase family protein [Peptoniphilus harei]
MNKIFKNIVKIFAILFLALSFTACTSKAPEGATLSSGDPFPKFDAVDFKGKEVNSEVFKDSPVTIMSIWFTGCKGCINEMPTLQKISEDLKDKNVKVMSICLDTYENKKIKDEAQKIIDAKGVKYPNLAVKPSEEIDAYLKNLTAFPTTLLIGRDGKVIDNISLGSQDKIDELYKKIDEIIASEGK